MAKEQLKKKKKMSDECGECSTRDVKIGLGCMCCSGFSLFLIILLAMSLVTIGPDETGLSYNRISATLGDEALSEGLQLIPAFGTVLRWPKVYTSVEAVITCNSVDGLAMTLAYSFQYVPRLEELYDLTLDFKDFDTYSALLRVQAVSSLSHVCGDFTAEEFQTRRSEVSVTMNAELEQQLSERFSATLARFQLKNIDRPTSFENAVKAKEDARSDIQLAENEREQLLTKARTTLATAAQEQARLLDTANSQSRILEKQAVAFAAGVVSEYESLAQVYEEVIASSGLTVDGILQYMSNQVFSTTDSVVAASTPSKINFQADL